MTNVASSLSCRPHKPRVPDEVPPDQWQFWPLIRGVAEAQESTTKIRDALPDGRLDLVGRDGPWVPPNVDGTGAGVLAVTAAEEEDAVDEDAGPADSERSDEEASADTGTISVLAACAMHFAYVHFNCCAVILGHLGLCRQLTTCHLRFSRRGL